MSYPQPTYTHPIPPPPYHQPPYTPITTPTYQLRPEYTYPNHTYNSSPYEPPYLQYSEEPKPPGVTSLSESEDLGKTSVSSADQLWLKAWLKSQNISLNAKEDTKPEEKSLLETRKKTFKCVQLHNELKRKTMELEVSEISTEEWVNKKQEIEELKSQIKETLHSLTNPKETERLKLKIAKRQRHKNWRKKHIKKLQTVRDERQRRRETLHKDIDEWRAEWLEKDTILKEEAARKFEADSKVEQVELKRNKHKDLTDLLKEIQKLRDLRRDKMKKEGHFFSDQDNQFFNEISKLDEAIQQEGKQLDDMTTEANESKRKEAIEAGMKERGTDSIFEYYNQAKFDLDSLVHIRCQWDSFIVPRGTYGASRIPPRFVDPAPPGNHIWASCLVLKE